MFGKKKKTPQELIKSLDADIKTINENRDKKIPEKVLKNYSATISLIKVMLYGDVENEPVNGALELLVAGIIESNCLFLMIANMDQYESEVKY
jgi:hypothetical protein